MACGLPKRDRFDLFVVRNHAGEVVANITAQTMYDYANPQDISHRPGPMTIGDMKGCLPIDRVYGPRWQEIAFHDNPERRRVHIFFGAQELEDGLLVEDLLAENVSEGPLELSILLPSPETDEDTATDEIVSPQDTTTDEEREV